MVSEWEILLRLTLSCVLGGVIGYERQSRRKSAGLRTNMLVCLGSCLVMLISTAIYQGVEGRTNADPARLAAQVVSGIGFLGAGAIMKEGLTVTGLTTASAMPPCQIHPCGMQMTAIATVATVPATVTIFGVTPIRARTRARGVKISFVMERP